MFQDDIGESGSSAMLLDFGESGSGALNVTSFDNLSCAARNIQGPVALPYSTALTTVVRAILSIYLVILLFAGMSLNTLVIVLVAKYKKLQTYAFANVLQVIVLNLFLLLLTLVALISVISNRWVFGEHICGLSGLLLFILTGVRTLLMCVFVIDRFLSVFFPFFFSRHKVKISSILSLASWIFIVISYVPSLPYFLDCYTFSADTWLCGASSACSTNCALYHTAIYTGVLAPAAVVPVILYIILYVKARRVMKKIRTEHDKSQMERKSTITFFMLFITVFVLYVPGATIAIILSILYSTAGQKPAVVYIISTISIKLVAAILLTDPIVIMRHEDMRNARQMLFQEGKVKFLSISSRLMKFES